MGPFDAGTPSVRALRMVANELRPYRRVCRSRPWCGYDIEHRAGAVGRHPLSYSVNSGYNYSFSSPKPVLILTINVGGGGGAAQTYAFDTGSSIFLAPNSVLAGGASTVLASGVNVETYGSGSTSTLHG